ncbi:MAG: hypothetical protein ACKON8_12350 [Planctomycetota bacterium]
MPGALGSRRHDHAAQRIALVDRDDAALGSADARIEHDRAGPARPADPIEELYAVR